MEGAQPFHPAFDCHGMFAKSPQDIAQLTRALLNSPEALGITSGLWAGLKVGFLDPTLMLLGPGEVKPNESYPRQYVCHPCSSPSGFQFTDLAKQIAASDAINRIRAAGGDVVTNVHLTSVEEIAKLPNGVDFDVIACQSYLRPQWP